MSHPICPRRPVGVGIHLGEGDCTLPLIGFSATPPSLWPGRELRKFHCFVRGNDIQFSRYVLQLWASPRLGCCPCCDHSVPENRSFSKKYFVQNKKHPSEQAAQCCLPGGAQLYIELKFFSDCRQFLHNTLQFQTELLICQTLLLQLVS